MATEEQTQYDVHTHLYAASYWRAAQKLTIANREVTKLAFVLKKDGSPTDDITFGIRRVSDNGLIASKVWGNAATLTTSPAWKEAELDSPVTINEEVYIYAEYNYGDASDHPHAAYKNSDVKADEIYSEHFGTTWYDRADRDLAYIYTYTDPPAVGGGGGPANLVAAGVI